ncbi:uncharacterized protein FOMMEDRAFT_137886 [Fomitiporia mediterranea MF3/22]|uniref:uncharacterized protein n=1 Tax=Fomitiporia mediterranea (strain MF3/22) TaxID=694068 RepID=UPI000440927F|nr:uncharacterized protein FOMMEDRAFT_137886 [Fomitiporia mediterranea MF3/22]EJD07633.1 hypothetical protein FOMMEDRAFT_137886 [Fomitiporia mediterranea MF3/22]
MSVLRSLSGIRRERRDVNSLPYSQTGRPSTPHKTQQQGSSWILPKIQGLFSMVGFGAKPEDEPTEDESDANIHQDDEAEQLEEIPLAGASTEPTHFADNLPPKAFTASGPPPRRAASHVASVSNLPSPSSDNLAFASSGTSLLDWAKQKLDRQTPMNEMEVMGLKSFAERLKERTHEPEDLCFGSYNSIVEWARQKMKTRSALNEMEVMGLQSFVENQRERTYEPEKLRFGSHESATPTPSPVDAAASASFTSSMSLPTFTNNASANRSASAPRRMLRKDPNGSIVWRGGGRARSTPAQSRRRPAPETPKPDTSKRRKLYEEPSGQSGMSTSQSAPASRLNGAGPSTPRLPRAGIVRAHAAPYVSSPLRNVVNGSPPASPPSKMRASPSTSSINGSVGASSSANQTFSASFLSEVIEKVTPPPKQPDVANPYQTAAPVKPVYKPMEKKRMSERRGRSRIFEDKEVTRSDEVEKKAPSIRDEIEASVPKGYTRSRPPPGFNKSKAANASASQSTSKPIIEELVDDAPPAKKPRTVMVEEVSDEEDILSGTASYVRPTEVVEPQEPPSVPVRTPPTTVPSNHFGPSKASALGPGNSNLPKEPSKLRTSFLPDDDENETPKESGTSAPSETSSMTTPSAPLSEIQEKRDPKEIALSLPLSELPTFVFHTSRVPAVVDHVEVREAVKALPLSALPTFDFSKAKVTSTAGPSNPAPAVKPFDFAAAGLKSSAPSGGDWRCSSCMLQNPVSALEKCTICETPRPGAGNATKPPTTSAGSSSASAPSSAPVKAFDFAAAGMKAPSAPSGGTWECSSCMLKNPPTALEKCTICETPRPGAKPGASAPAPKAMPPPTTTVPKAFDWAAAGMAPKSTSGGGDTWTCGTCMLSNPASATEKCTICEAPR